MRTYGELWLSKGVWHLQCEPHVAVMAKRVFAKMPKDATQILTLAHSPENCRQLQWFDSMYPLQVLDRHLLDRAATDHVQTIARLRAMDAPTYVPRSFELAVAPRRYQQLAAELHLTVGGLLLADDVGLGKTCSAICSLTDQRTLPALIVCPAHLQRQWEREVKRFIPSLRTHIIRKTDPYPLPETNGRLPDVRITSYHKLNGWATTHAESVQSIILDEGQELRKTRSLKYVAAKVIAQAVPYRLALSATPIYNYGGEIYNIIDLLRPDALGTWDEFCREWCDGGGRDKASLKNPAAFGSYLREQSIMLRRTRQDVGRELPPLMRQTMPIDADASALDQIEDAAHELAKIIMADQGHGLTKMQAAAELDVMIRQATGIAKAPHVAAFVELLIENGEPVVLFGWHRAVYDIWASRLSKHNPAFYTGEESAAKKQAEVDRFVQGETPLLIVSLRSGAGLDGLQGCCRTAVFGELDWSPSVHEQCIGRVYRDGQAERVSAFFLLADEGSDPLVAEILGLKREQSDGLRGVSQSGPLQQVAPADGIRQLAERYATKKAISRKSRGK